MQATSALDAGSKALVQKAHERMDARRFALVMAQLDEGCALPAPADVRLSLQATSALDAESEALVQEALELFEAGHTVLIRAQRRSTVKTESWCIKQAPA